MTRLMRLQDLELGDIIGEEYVHGFQGWSLGTFFLYGSSNGLHHTTKPPTKLYIMPDRRQE